MFATREEWLNAAVNELRDWFKDVGVTVPVKVRVACAWTKRPQKGAIAWCWPTKSSADGYNEIQVTPEIADPLPILGSLIHELIHAADDCESKHGAHFKQAARAIGLTGKMTATIASPGLEGRLTGLAARLGPYPHGTLNPSTPIDGKPKQTTRMLKIICPMDGYTLRTTQKWVDVGLPYCPCGMEMNLDEKDEGD